MFNRRIIGLVAPALSGKTSFGEHIVYKYGYYRLSIASVLKNMLNMFLSDDNIYGNNKHKPNDLLCGKTLRYAMQTLGTEWGRNMIGEDIWINILMQKIKDNYKNDNIVIDDVRYKNEAMKIEEIGGILIRIINRSIRVDRSHTSEVEGLDIKTFITVRNDGTLEDYYKAIDNIMENINAI